MGKDDEVDERDAKSGFWSTLPGFVVKLTAFCVAMTGLITALAPYLPSDPKPSPPPPPIIPIPNKPDAKLSESIPQQITSPASPELLLNNYARTLTEKDFIGLKEIYPRVNEIGLTEWLQGTNGKAPIATIQVVGLSKRIVDSEDEVTLRATMQYCRKDRKGSRDIKNYTFTQKNRVWQLDSISAAENVTPIQC